MLLGYLWDILEPVCSRKCALLSLLPFLSLTFSATHFNFIQMISAFSGTPSTFFPCGKKRRHIHFILTQSGSKCTSCNLSPVWALQ